MGLMTGLLTLPLAPLRGVVAVAELVRGEAERQYFDPAAIRRALDDIDRRRAEGTLSDEDAAVMEEQLMSRLVQQPRRPADGRS